MSQQQEKQDELSPEEIKNIMDKSIAFWDGQIPYLTKQKEYEVLRADIDEVMFKREVIRLKRAEMMMMSNQPPKQEGKV